MRITIIHSYYYPDVKGGAEYSLKKLAEGLIGRGIEVSVICDNPDGNMDDNVNGVRVYRRKMHYVRESHSFIAKVKRAILELYNLQNAEIIRRVIELEQPDVIYTNCLEHISPVAWTVAHRHGIRIVDTQRVYVLLEMAGGKYKVGNRLWRGVNRWLSGMVDSSAFISEYTEDKFVRAGFFRKATHHVIYNAIDFDEQQTEVYTQNHICRRREKEKIRFVYLGTLSEHKGIQTLLEAFEKLASNDIELHIAGDGPMKSIVTSAMNNDRRIRYYGWLQEKEINCLLNECDVLVCPSIWPEPFGRVVLDAYKHGMPVISTVSGGLRETVVNEKTGLQIDASDVVNLEKAMLRMIEDDALYITCCKGAMTKIREFSLERYLDRFIAVFTDELKGARNAK